MVSWEYLKRTAAYVAGEIWGEEAREKVERLTLEDREELGLAEPYTRLLTLLSAVGRVPPVPPQAKADHVLHCAAHSQADPTRPTPTKDTEETQDKKMQERIDEKVTSTNEHESEKDLGLIWVSCSCKEAIVLVGEALVKRARVYVGEQPPVGEEPSSVIFCPKGEDVMQGVRHLRTLAPDVPLLLFGWGLEPTHARSALLAGAQGFIHLGMSPAQVARALSAASEGETIISRDLLEALLVEIQQRADLGVLTPGQREILERLCEAATVGDEITVSRGLLETFLVELATLPRRGRGRFGGENYSAGNARLPDPGFRTQRRS